MNIDEIKEKLCEIKQMGYVVSKRKGDTGIGYTLETLLGLKENNFKTPDFGQIELKSRRKGRNSRITMFTLNRNVWIIDKKEVIERYGYLDKKDRKALKCTINSKPNNQGFYVRVEQAGVRIYHAEGQLTTEWQRDYLIETFKEKMSNLLIVNADTRRNSDKNEEFWYNEAFLLTQLNAENFLDFIRNDIIIIDLTYTPQLLIWNITFFDVSTKEVENLIMNGFKIYNHSLGVIALLCQSNINALKDLKDAP